MKLGNLVLAFLLTTAVMIPAIAAQETPLVDETVDPTVDDLLDTLTLGGTADASGSCSSEEYTISAGQTLDGNTLVCDNGEVRVLVCALPDIITIEPISFVTDPVSGLLTEVVDLLVYCEFGTVQGSVTNLTVDVQDRYDLNVSWNPPATGADVPLSYLVYADDQPFFPSNDTFAAEVPGDQLYALLEDYDAGTTWYVNVTAKFNNDTIAPYASPGASNTTLEYLPIENLTVEDVGFDSVLVNVTFNNTNEEDNVEFLNFSVTDEAGNTTYIVLPNNGDGLYNLTGLDPETNYTVNVTAVHGTQAAAASAPSAPDQSFQTLADPNAGNNTGGNNTGGNNTGNNTGDNTGGNLTLGGSTTPTADEGDVLPYNLTLESAPAANRTFHFEADDGLVVSPENVTLNGTNWQDGVDVSITIADDAVVNGDRTLEVRVYEVNETGALTLVDTILVDVTDDEVAGLTVTGGTTTLAEGASTTFSVKLAEKPEGDVTVSVATTGDVTASPATLTFTTTNWNTAKTVTVSATDDDRKLTGRTGSVTFASETTGYDFADVTRTMSITDNDTPGFTVTPATLALDEGETKSFSVVLNSQPPSTVVLKITTDRSGVTLSDNSLSFTSSNWDTAQTVDVTAVDDTAQTGDFTVIVTVGVDSGVNDFTSLADKALSVTIDDEETVNDRDDDGVPDDVDPAPDNPLIPRYDVDNVQDDLNGTTLTLTWDEPEDDRIEAVLIWDITDPDNPVLVDTIAPGIEEYVIEDFSGVHQYAIQPVLEGQSRAYNEDVTEESDVVYAPNVAETSCASNAQDTDGDGLCDSLENIIGTDRNLADSDGDGFTDAEEVTAGTDPNNVNEFPQDVGDEDDNGIIGEPWFWIGLALLIGSAIVLLVAIVQFAGAAAAGSGAPASA